MEQLPIYKSKSLINILAFVIGLALILSLSGFFLCAETPVHNNPPTPVPAGATPINGTAIPTGALCVTEVGEACTTPGATCWFFDTCTNIYDTTTGECRCACL